MTPEQELLASIWLYVDWRLVTRNLTTSEKEMWADAVDERSRLYAEECGGSCCIPFEPVADRWWRQ